VIMPDHDGLERLRRLEVDLDILFARAELDEIAVLTRFLTVRDAAHLADDRLHVAGYGRLVQGDELRSGRDEEGPPRFAGDLLQVRAVDVPRSADEHRLGKLELELLFPLFLGRPGWPRCHRAGEDGQGDNQ